ncbi:hypothetical protein [Nonomuraea sp. NPDC049709]|uniref:hypothetical protein n=1 Tax=Nonomuraea sp. NPDC049709 TaxID=3154736 RepID=UPI00342E19C9
MAVVLTRMRLLLLWRVTNGMLIAGVMAGLLLAVATVTFGTSADVLAAAFAVWALGWLIGPLFTGGGDGGLRPEYFTRLPMTARRLAKGLLAAAFAGPGPVITAVAFASLVVFGARLGVLPGLVAVPAAAAQLLLVILASRVVVGLLGEVMRTRLGAVLVALPWAAVIAAASNIGIVALALARYDVDVSRWLLVLPPNWGIVAVQAAARADWLVCVSALTGLALLIVMLLAAWARLLDRRMSGVLARRTRHPAGDGLLVPLLPATPLAAVAAKELREWSRDTLRSYHWYFAIAFGLSLCLMPLAIDLTWYLPWTGAAITWMAAAGAATLFSTDGTALWLTLMRPGAERTDVRGRQLAWLLKVAPLSVVATVAGTALSGLAWAWPPALALQAVALGAGAGLVVLLSVMAPVRMPDAHRRTGNAAADGPNIVGLVWAMIGLIAACALPSAAAVAAGHLLNLIALQWAGVALAVVTGAGYAWLFGRIAYRRLQTAGPELLFRLRTGRSATTGRAAVPLPGHGRRRLLIGLCLGTAWTPLLSAVLSLVNLATRTPSRTFWTFPLGLPPALQVPAIVILVAAALVLYVIAIRTLLTLLRARAPITRTSNRSV